MGKSTEIRIIPVGMYLIKAGVVGGARKAVVLVGRKKLAEFESASVEEAIETAKIWLEERRQVQTQERSGDRKTIGSAAEYADFFLSNELADYEIEMLRSHARKKNATMGEIVETLGWDYKGGNRWYGGLGLKIARSLGLELRNRADESEIGISALSMDGERRTNGHYVLAIYPEVVEGMKLAGVMEPEA